MRAKERYRVFLLAMPDTQVSLNEIMQMPNLAIASLAGNLDNCEVKIQDLVCIRKNTRQFIEKVMREFRPHVVGISSMTFQYPTARTVARWIRDVRPDVKLVLGGYHGSLTYDGLSETGDIDPFDFIIRGEGEKTLHELVDELQSSKPDLSSVRGLSYRENGTFLHNAPRDLSELSTIRLPDRTRRIVHTCRIAGLFPTDVIEASRGCTMACNFCCITRVYGRNFRKFEIPRIIEDIARVRSSGAESLFFVDDNLTLDVDFFEELCEAILSAGFDDVHYQIQASSIGISSSERLVKKMARAGFDMVFIGIENVSRHNLEQLGKGDIVEQSRVAARYLHKYNIGLIAGLIVGNPDDREQDIVDNFNFARELDAEILYVQYLNPYPKTVLREELEALDLIVNKTDLSMYNGFFCNVRTKHLSKEDLVRIYSREVIRFILHSLKPWVLLRNSFVKRYLFREFLKFHWLRFLLTNRWLWNLLVNSIKKRPGRFEIR